MPALDAFVERLNERYGLAQIAQRDPRPLRRYSLARAAVTAGSVEPGSVQERLVARWPRAIQEALRGTLLTAISRRKPVSFDWAPGDTDQITVEELRDRIRVHFTVSERRLSRLRPVRSKQR